MTARVLMVAALFACSTLVGAANAEPYKRSLYKHWIDADRDCRDTREEVLIDESRIEVTFDRTGCKVVRGQWFDPYTGRIFTNPKRIDIDHFVPLKEVHRSGGSRWGAERRQAYANDLDSDDTLIAVSASANRSKGDKDPSRWMPPDRTYHCDYIERWVAVKAHWNLTVRAREQRKIDLVLAACH